LESDDTAGGLSAGSLAARMSIACHPRRPAGAGGDRHRWGPDHLGRWGN